MHAADTRTDSRPLRSLLEAARQALADSPTAQLDAELLLAHALGQPRSRLYSDPDLRPGEDVLARFHELVARRCRGEPVAYLLGMREFWSLPLTVTPATLIPRPETELLVERAVALLRGRHGARVADLGTGSGAIAIALARELPGTAIVATDNDPAALAVARRNAERHCPGRIGFRAGDWCEPLRGERLDLIIANPPYVAEGDPALGGELRFEPRSALAAGGDGLAALTAITATAAGCLRPGGGLLLEHGAGQATAVRRLLEGAGYTAIESWTDLAGLPRAVVGRRPG